MKINYRVLSYSEKDHSMTVRYWTDNISEDDLAIIFDEYGKIVYNANGHPVRIKTDVNITFYNNPNPSNEDILTQIERSAPSLWLYNLEQTKISNTQFNLENVASFIGVSNSFTHNSNVSSSNVGGSIISSERIVIERAAKVAIRYIQTGVYDLGNTGSYII